ncbi:MAG: hypothetical protein IJ303_02060 [Clostridia bacterium]|nr:hypothetical protein [Clostridia bacterium]
MECFLAGDDMAFYKFADRIFELKNKYSYTDKLCADYAVLPHKPDYVIEVSEDEIMAERLDSAASAPPPYLEALAIYRKICEKLSSEDCMLMHSAVIEYEGKAYAFSAKSGTGKTTHVSLWQKAFGDGVRIINGDKPLVRRVKKGDGFEFIAYGTPWCGKERKNINTSATLCGFFILERCESNFAERAGAEAIPHIMGQMLLKKDGVYLSSLMSFVDALITNVPVYRLGVNMDIEAAIVARNAVLSDE